MLLSRLCYEAIKAAKFLDDPEFTYEGFRSGRFDGNRDYSRETANVFFPVNGAIRRLCALGKVPPVSEPRVVYGDGRVDMSGIGGGAVRSIASRLPDGTVERLPFDSGTDAGGNAWARVANPTGEPFPAVVTWDREIPEFGRGDFDYPEEGEHRDVELCDYGLSETACHIAAEYAKGELFMAYDPDMGQSAMKSAEAMMATLPGFGDGPGQRFVRSAYGPY